MILNFAVLALCAVITVAAVRLFLINGIDIVSTRLGLSSKAKGQIIGYATSSPELVVVISSAIAGAFGAGFWNIASSNIINFILFFSAAMFYRQQKDFFNRQFIDEAVFGILSIGIPIVMYSAGVGQTLWVAFLLIGFFILYRIVDVFMNRKPSGSETKTVENKSESTRGLFKGIVLIIIGLGIIVGAGKFLGTCAYNLINDLAIPSWMVGWILGFITSIPELTSFFEIYRIEKEKGTLHLLDDTQQAIDALVASNMSNLGVIYPIGVIIFVALS